MTHAGPFDRQRDRGTCRDRGTDSQKEAEGQAVTETQRDRDTQTVSDSRMLLDTETSRCMDKLDLWAHDKYPLPLLTGLQLSGVSAWFNLRGSSGLG